MIGVTSSGLLRNRQLPALLGEQLVRIGLATSPLDLNAIAGWGQKSNVRSASLFSLKHGLPLLRLEDGFLRSFGTGARFPQLSLVVDGLGIYYDSTRPSSLEAMLASSSDLLIELGDDVARAKTLILGYRLSKYNNGPLIDSDVQVRSGARRILVVDQTVGDMSVLLGAASAQTFSEMLAAARIENPDAIIYVKTHPETSEGRKSGHLTRVKEDARTVVLRELANPLSLIEQMDRVYVVSSNMGFEALLAGKAVSVFGMPWYAGWGVTDDRQQCTRRNRQRTVDELFAAAYFHYTRYLDPVTHQRGTIFDVIDWLIRQRSMANRFSEPSGRLICLGFRRWKAANIRPMLSLESDRVHFVRDANAARKLAAGPQDCLVYWGGVAPAGVDALALQAGTRLLRMEDGFVRSVGLGADLVAPLSLVLDEDGIYFDPERPSGLERLLNATSFTPQDISRAASVRQLIVSQGITKYNTEHRQTAGWADDVKRGRAIVLVPGQVEDDASIRLGCEDVRTNLGLLQAARAAQPDAFIIYKPHPDVLARNRSGAVATAALRQFADHVETDLSIVSCIEACDIVHTMTSLTGFDALLRHRHVVVHGRPFYAGWGLTEDRLQMQRRERTLKLDELVAGVLLHYPLYWDWELRGYTTCEAVLRQIIETRARREAGAGTAGSRVGHARRQWRKLKVLARNWRG